ncbi:metallophosphoesterase [Asticcacaulis biprosthecium]|uniref:metallophosphoesterase n=1 Tax=Asticcacaulis biprosthecium TaxID=76891 RepID=UPI00030A801B|nr:metallophosphoesterase [Asticcacaulis biprosthecium]
MIRFVSICLALAGLSACASLPHGEAPARVEFVVIGDTPYNASDEAMLATAIPKIKAINPPFVVHVGDVQSGGEVCGAPDDRFAALVEALRPIPVVYTPGDNEWTDCDRKDMPGTTTKFSELARLDTLRSRFFATPALTDPSYAYVQQTGQPENARFLHAGLVWTTLHITGTNNGRDSVMGDDLTAAAKAAEARELANVGWLNEAFTVARAKNAQGVVVIMQADMVTEVDPTAFGHPCYDAVAGKRETPCDGFFPVRDMLPALAASFGKPVFLIHGDTGPFRVFQSWAPGQVYELNAAGDVWYRDSGEMCAVRDVTHVWIDLDATEPLRAQGLVTGEVPGTTPSSASDCK